MLSDLYLLRCSSFLLHCFVHFEKRRGFRSKRPSYHSEPLIGMSIASVIETCPSIVDFYIHDLLYIIASSPMKRFFKTTTKQDLGLGFSFIGTSGNNNPSFRVVLRELFGIQGFES